MPEVPSEPSVVEIVGKTFNALLREEGVPGHAAGHSSDILGYRSTSLNRSADEYGWSDQYIFDFQSKSGRT